MHDQAPLDATTAEERQRARAIWQRLETLHAVTYFAPEPVEASAELGLQGFWRGYFAFRSAPLGPVGAAVVVATFANFEPGFVARRVPDVWSVTDPAAAVVARARSAAGALRRLLTDVEELAVATAPLLDRAIAACGPTGRPLFAANASLPVPPDPVEALWQRTTTLREHRGDGHVAALTAAGIDGCEAHVLMAADRGLDPTDLQQTRGWAPEQWAAATARLTERGLMTADELTHRGRALRAAVEDTTDALAAVPYRALDPSERLELETLLGPPARTVAGSGTIRYPNPMGLPAVD